MFYEKTYRSFDKVSLGRVIYAKSKPKNLGIYWITNIQEGHSQIKMTNTELHGGDERW